MSQLLIAVPTEDEAELTALSNALHDETTTLDSKPFDGATVIQLLVPVTAASIPVLTTWIKARFEHRKNQSISYKGMKFTGYSPDEVEQLMELLEGEDFSDDE